MNLLWIVVDCLRPDHLGCYGYGRATSPHIDRFARGCFRFEQAISPHVPTHPSHTTMFSGRDVFAHQIVAQGGTVEPPPGVRLLPDLLRQRGYFTGAVDNIGRWIEPAFERYDPYPRWDHDGTRPWRNGEQVTERALAMLRQAQADPRPFCVFLHYWDPHTPYLPPPPFDRMFYAGDERAPEHRAGSETMDPVWGSPWFANYFAEWMDGVADRRYVRAQYDASIAYTDACLTHVFALLEETGLLDDTAVVLMADHGEELDEHGLWFDHHGLYDTVVRVPLLLHVPGGLATGARGSASGTPGGQAVRGMVSTLDLAPTLLDLLGLPEVAAENSMSGRSLAPLLEGRPVPPLDGLYLTECTWMRKRGWRTPEWKLIRALEPDVYGLPPQELYDLRADPGEQRNVAAERPEVVGDLSAAMDAWVARRLAETELPDPSIEQAGALRTWQPRFIAGRRSA